MTRIYAQISPRGFENELSVYSLDERDDRHMALLDALLRRAMRETDPILHVWIGSDAPASVRRDALVPCVDELMYLDDARPSAARAYIEARTSSRRASPADPTRDIRAGDAWTQAHRR